jgi:hypothetical protein
MFWRKDYLYLYIQDVTADIAIFTYARYFHVENVTLI